MDDNLPLGGKTILFSGDWRQCGPIIKFDTARDVVDDVFVLTSLGIRSAFSSHEINERPGRHSLRSDNTGGWRRKR